MQTQLSPTVDIDEVVRLARALVSDFSSGGTGHVDTHSRLRIWRNSLSANGSKGLEPAAPCPLALNHA